MMNGGPMTDHDLTQAMQELATVNRRLLRTQTWWYLLLHGILVGIGGTIGVAVVVSGLLSLINRLSGIPGADTARYLLENSVVR